MLYEQALTALSLVLQHKLMFFNALLGYVIGQKIFRYWTSPLRKQGIPGPFLAKFTNLYRWYGVLRRNWHRDLVAIHDHYGPVVWIAPDEISVSDPKFKSIIYSFADGRQEQSYFQKGPAFETGRINEDFNFLFETEPSRARNGRHTLSHYYSEKGLSSLEGDFDKTVEDMIFGLKKHHMETGRLADFSLWSNMLMTDLTTQLACNYSSGLLRAGRDYRSFISSFRFLFDVVGSLMPLPFALKVTSRLIRKKLLWIHLNRLYRVCLGFKDEAQKEERINGIVTGSPDHFLAKFHETEIHMRAQYPNGNRVESITNNLFMLIAGSVGVLSNVLPNIIQQLVLHPHVLQKVREELAQFHTGKDIIPISSWVKKEGESSRLSYLEAVVLETIRYHPPFSISLSRIVPPIGCRLDQYNIPPGYIVGMSAFPTNQNKTYFGDDASEFKPERWLGNHPTELAKDGTGLPRTMRSYQEAGWMTFGAGARVCVGRHLSMITLMKSTAKLVEEFEMEMVKAPKEWYGFSIHLDDMIVDIKPRKGAA